MKHNTSKPYTLPNRISQPYGPDILANEIIENIEAGLENFMEVMETINGKADE
ncbi:MAG: hypothetical protein RIC19_13395 [Phaeodactylibacter sp.]|uniref:hypothetical protein n=1 Tax=Phaeodactylibacter sp. TaxID=1940289 RepID=UPI0032EB027F